MFSIYSYFKITIWSIIILSLVFITAIFFSNDSIDVDVKPSFTGKFYDSSIVKFNEINLTLTGNLTIPNPTIYQKIILPQSHIEFGFLRNLFIIICCVVLLKILPNTTKENLLKKDISKQILAIGILCILYSFVEVFQVSFASKIIRQLTNNQFIAEGYQLQNILFIIGGIICWFSKLYRQAYQLKQDQKLTI